MSEPTELKQTKEGERAVSTEANDVRERAEIAEPNDMRRASRVK